MADGAKKRHGAEKIWLHYFNQQLYDKNFISLAQRNAIALKIEGRTPAANSLRRQPGIDK